MIWNFYEIPIRGEPKVNFTCKSDSKGEQELRLDIWRLIGESDCSIFGSRLDLIQLLWWQAGCLITWSEGWNPKFKKIHWVLCPKIELGWNIQARKNREEAKAVQQQWGEEEAVLTERGRWIITNDFQGLSMTLRTFNDFQGHSTTFKDI